MTVLVLDPAFDLPANREATAPPEARGLTRDGVKLLVSDRGTLTHATFCELPQHLRAGDLVVVNNSATMTAAVPGRIGPQRVILHFSTWLDDGSWVVEVRTIDGHPHDSALVAGTTVALPDGVVATLQHPWLPPAQRLWIAHISGAASVSRFLRNQGRPITYAYVRQHWSATYYETIFGREYGSAEMPSAGRPFTDRMVTDLAVRGVAVAPITLHTGVSSPETGEPPSPERFTVPQATAALVEHTRRNGGRVIAVGTTVTRALESVADTDGHLHPRTGWTNLVLSANHPTRVVDGLVTGWHAPGASHLMLLEAVVGATAVRTAYDAALDTGYLWHEFGDSALLLR